MEDLTDEIAELTKRAPLWPAASGIPGVMITKGEVPQHQLAAVYEPIIGFTVHGRKTISFGDQTIHSAGPSYYVIPTETPATGKVHQGDDGRPYLSVGLRINKNSLLDLMKDVPESRPGFASTRSISACRAPQEFTETWVRLLRLLKNPQHIPALAPACEREILYRVLIGPQGWRLKDCCLKAVSRRGIHAAIEAIRKNFTTVIDVQSLAATSGMAWTTFHRQFKQTTGLSPIQYQKELRLLEARKIMVYGDVSVREAAFQVGYESPSQFNREYSRHFGSSPAKDIANIRRRR